MPSAACDVMPFAACLLGVWSSALETAERPGPCEVRRKNPHLNRAKFRLRMFCMGLGGLTPGRIYSWGEMPQEIPLSTQPSLSRFTNRLVTSRLPVLDLVLPPAVQSDLVPKPQAKHTRSEFCPIEMRVFASGFTEFSQFRSLQCIVAAISAVRIPLIDRPPGGSPI